MSATLPTNFNPNHAPTALELAQVLNAITRITNITLVNSLIAGAFSISTTSSSYADVTGGSWAFTKNGDASSSNLLVLFSGGWRAITTAPTSIGVGVQVNGVDTNAGQQECTTAGNLTQHFAFGGGCMISSVPAGAYTMKMRAKRNGGTGTVVIDSTDCWTVVTIEVPL